MKTIQLTQNQAALVDDQDYPELSRAQVVCPEGLPHIVCRSQYTAERQAGDTVNAPANHGSVSR